MVRYFYGKDIYAARQAIEALAASLSARAVFIDRSDIEQESLRARIDKGGGSLFGKQLVVVRDPSSFPASVQAGFVELPEAVTSFEAVLWDRVKPDKKSALWRAFKKEAKEFPLKSGSEVAQWLMQEATVMGGILDMPGAQELIRRVGQDRYQLLSELQILTLRSKAIGRIEVAGAISDTSQPELIFALTDALLVRNRMRALKVLEDLLGNGEHEIALVGFMASQIRMLLLIQAGVEAGLSAEGIARQYGFHPYPVQKSMPIVKRYTRGQLLDMYTRIMATDFAMKGRVEPRTALTMLVMGMTAPRSFAKPQDSLRSAI
ncbi:MAG: DNA polymerase III subunit delta [Candidatus Andersenbacteria bacterium]|nr:DNA polymerase III subunit delta [Candidatus Andersenbacteria bacterium]